jgi:hypothetical protein
MAVGREDADHLVLGLDRHRHVGDATQVMDLATGAVAEQGIGRNVGNHDRRPAAEDAADHPHIRVENRGLVGGPGHAGSTKDVQFLVAMHHSANRMPHVQLGDEQVQHVPHAFAEVDRRRQSLADLVDREQFDLGCRVVAGVVHGVTGPLACG